MRKISANNRYWKICRLLLLPIWIGATAEAVAGIPQQQSQEIILKGTVVDGSNLPIPGATLSIVGTGKGTTTNAEGNYTLKVPHTGVKIIISSLGYAKVEMVYTGKNAKNFRIITLYESSEKIDELEIVAFGKQKKESVVSSISTIKPSELRVPSSNLTTAIAGRFAGVIAYQRSGEPGQDNAQFFVRGVTTFGYKKDPLILIDGVEFSSADLARLQTDDIASFSIMKDATSTSLYGARGANGVIYITTKEGAQGKAKVDIRFETSLSKPIRDILLADPITYMKLHNEAVRTRTPLARLPYSEQKIDYTAAGINRYVFPSTDWQKALFKDYTINRRFNLNVSGGGKVARYYVAGSFSQDNGILKMNRLNNFNNNIDLKKYLLRSNININLTSTTEMVVRLHGTFDDYNGPINGGESIYNMVMSANPVLFPPAYAPDEKNKFTPYPLFGNYGAGNYINPYAELVKGYRQNSSTNVFAQMELKQDLKAITKGLSIRFLGNTSRQSYFDVSRSYKPYYYQVDKYNSLSNTYTLKELNPQDGTQYLDYTPGGKSVINVLYGEAVLNYNRTFGEKHDVSGLLVAIARESVSGNESTLQESLPYRNLGISGRATYAYDSRYFVEYNFGYNGSERFSQGNRFGFFPSVGVGWKISNEKFWKPLEKIVHNLKIRGTFGLVGNDAIGGSNDRFFYLSQVNLDNKDKLTVFGENFDFSRKGVSISRYANALISWERAKKVNLGIELGFLNSIDILCDVYYEQRDNILMDRSYIPPEMGLEAIVRANVGKAYSQGVDISIDYRKNFANSLWLTGRGNFTYATGKYLVYEEPPYNDTPWLRRKGRNINQQQGYIAERLFIDQNDVANSPKQFGEYMAGDIKYRDINNDGVIDFRDEVPIGYPSVPEVNYGFGFSLGYRWVDISCFFQGVARTSFWIDPKKTAPFIHTGSNSEGSSNNALLRVYADSYWSELNQNIYARWPRLANRLIDNNNKLSTWFMQNGSYLRLKNMEVGINLPQRLCSKFGLQRFRLYFSGTNLLTISSFKLWDPEMGGNGLGYPIQQVFNVGLLLSF